MGRVMRWAAAVLVLGAAMTSWSSYQAGATSGGSTPRWVLHVEHFPGGLSGTVRAQAMPDVQQAEAAFGHAPRVGPLGVQTPIGAPLHNLQMNADSVPPLPQDETSVAFSLINPKIAVAASNDFVEGGVAVMRTTDGGRTWSTQFITPEFDGTGEFCFGGDPSVAYSLRDHAFYFTQLCFFASSPVSEVHLYKSVDNGRTWTAPSQRALVMSNFNYRKGVVDPSVFFDKEYLTVDNTPTSPHFGRIYVTFIKFHMLPSGFSDFCPVQLAFTDQVPTLNPALASFHHIAVVPDQPGGPGKGPSANQWAYPKVDRKGNLDIPYVLENCNTGFDRHLEFQRSTTGGRTFLPNPIRIDKPGQFKDNPSRKDLLPPTHFRAGISPSFAINQATGVLAYVYQNNVNRATSGADISIQFSHDGGFHWTNSRFLAVTSTGSPAPNDQFFPWIDSDQAGRWHVIWFDRRRDPTNVRIDTFQDDFVGTPASFHNRRISTVSWNPNHGFFGCGCFIGDYNGLASSNAVIYPVWTDGRNSAFARTGIGETDIFTNVEIRR